MTGDQVQGEELAVQIADLVNTAEASAPPSRVDPLLAVRQGRARRRRTWSVVAAVAAMALASGSFAVLQGGGSVRPSGGGTPSVLPSLTSSPTASPTSGSASTHPSQVYPLPTDWAVPTHGRSVLTVGAKFGWLPDEVAAVEYRSDPYGVSMVARSSRQSSDHTFIILQAFPVGVEPAMGVFPPTGVPGTRVEAPPVNGREAYWFSTDDPGSAGMVVLRFRGSDGRWVDLSDTSGGDRLAERRQRLQQMASSVVSGDYTPPLPLSMSSLPPQTVVTTVTLTMPAKGGSDWGLMMGFQEQGTHNIGIDVVPQERASVPTTAFPTLPNGLPVQQKKCETGKGLQWCVDSLQPVPGSEVADPAAWMARVVPHGMDQKTWTTGLLP